MARPLPWDKIRQARLLRDKGETLERIAQRLGAANRATALRWLAVEGEGPPPEPPLHQPPPKREPRVKPPRPVVAARVPSLRLAPAPAEVAAIVEVANAAPPVVAAEWPVFDLARGIGDWACRLTDAQVAAVQGLPAEPFARALLQGEADIHEGRETEQALWVRARAMAQARTIALLAREAMELIGHPDPKVRLAAVRWMLERHGGAAWLPPPPVSVSVQQGLQVNAAAGSQVQVTLASTLAALHERRALAEPGAVLEVAG